MDTRSRDQIDERVKEMIEARQIVATIMDYGVTQAQIVRIIKLLGLELVNHDHMKAVVDVAKSIEESENQLSILI